MISNDCSLDWEIIVPDVHGDWFEQRNSGFEKNAPMGLGKMKAPLGIFSLYSMGVSTNRDAWVYSFDKEAVENNMSRCIDFYNQERIRWSQNTTNVSIDDFIDRNPEHISWTRGLKNRLKSDTKITFVPGKIRTSLYRPFCKQNLYYDEMMIEMPLRQMQLFPPNERYKNLEIIVSGIGHSKKFSALITDTVPCLDAIEKGQCFPLYRYEERNGSIIRHDAITDETLDLFRRVYPAGIVGRLIKDGGPTISKEDIFYYIYGILHSNEYRERFESNLKKELPRIPFAESFGSFCAVGRALANLHLHYETIEPYPLIIKGNEKDPGRVEKMRWGKKRNPDTKKTEEDKSQLIFNENLTFQGIPDAVQRYVVNGRTPLEWMIDRYQNKTDKASGIVNNPNLYDADPHYIPDLIKRLVTVSVETVKIVENMLPLNEKDCSIVFPDAWKEEYNEN